MQTASTNIFVVLPKQLRAISTSQTTLRIGESNIPVGLQNLLQNGFRYNSLSPTSSVGVLNQTPVML